MSITALPGSTFTVTIDGLATGLVGTLAVRIEDAENTIVTPASTAGIVESGVGVYTATLTAPETAGQYVVLADPGNGGLERGVTLTVPFSNVSDAAYPQGVTLAGLRAAVGVRRDDAATDELLDTYLQGAIDFARRYTRRTLEPIRDDLSDLVALSFYPGGRRRVRLPDAREILTVTADGVELAADAWRGEGVRDDLPTPYVFLRLEEPADRVVVSGRFGHTQIPALLIDAIIAHAARNYRERAASYADTVTIEGGDGSASLLSYFRQLPPRVQAGYNLMRVPDDWIGL